jgi:HPt (histidine-containing phosphotransfer) domain-containing protein
MDEYLTKPVSPSALTRTVERIVAERTSDSKPNGPANGNADAVLDPAGALERVDGDRELLGEIIGLFQQDIDTLMEELEAAVRSKDPEAIMRTAHRLKGSVATFAARPATAAALHLETMGREGNIADADAAFADLKTELARLQPVLESLRLEVQG